MSKNSLKNKNNNAKNQKKSISNNIKCIIKEINNFLYLMRKDRLDTYSSSAAFFMFLSLIPFVFLVLAIMPYTPVTEGEIVRIATELLPQKVSDLVAMIIHEVMQQNVAILSISVLAAIWSSSKSLQQLKLGLDEINGTLQFKSLFLVRLSAIFYTVLLVLAVIILLTLSIFSENFIHLIINYFPFFRENSDVTNVVKRFSQYREAIFIPVIFLIVLTFYCRMPKIKQKIKDKWIGALIVGIVWYLFTLLFNMYINVFNPYSMYGSLALVIIVLFWLYACMIIFFTGELLNYYLSTKSKKGKIKY